MIRKYFFGALAIAVLVASTMTASAQVGELRGHVWMQQADGQKVPLADAQIDVFRMDVKGEYHTKTNKKGEFVFAGLPFIGEYSVAASHPTAQPNFQPKVKAGREMSVEITVTPGDGKRLTMEEVKTAGATTAASGGSSGGNSGGGGESAADKAKREELMRKNKEIEESNKKITSANEIIARTFTAGNAALKEANAAIQAKNSPLAIQKYTEALAQFDEGLAADAEQPAILTNKAVSLKGRGVERFNAAVRSTGDDAAKNAALEGAKADFKAAAETATKAVTIIKAQPVPTEPAEVQRQTGNKYAAFITQSEAMRLYVTKVDGTQAEAGLAAFKEYIALETDPAKKAKAQLDAAQMLLDAGATDKAVAEFQVIVTASPDNVDANLGAGLALFATGDKTKFQDAANYLQHFVDVAPDDHKFKADAKAILAELKSTEKVVPEKTAPKARPKRP